jgi:hypothetical protein
MFSSLHYVVLQGPILNFPPYCYSLLPPPPLDQWTLKRIDAVNDFDLFWNGCKIYILKTLSKQIFCSFSLCFSHSSRNPTSARQRESEKITFHVVFVLPACYKGMGSLCRDIGRPWDSQSTPEPPQHIRSHSTHATLIFDIRQVITHSHRVS